MTEPVGKLKPVPIYDVWKHEAQDLTPWLSKNTEELSKVLGIDLDLEGTEIPVGPFSADLVLKDPNTGNRVLVENMMTNTDHDHIGKLITYAAGLEASYVVLIAEKFRTEHRTALSWLNANSNSSIHFFGLELKVWRIAESLPAPQLLVVVEPDEWARGIQEERSLTETQQAYRDFWGEYLSKFKERYPDWSNVSVPPIHPWINFPSGNGYLKYRMKFSWELDHYRFHIDLHLDAKQEERTMNLFNQLCINRTEIEAKFEDSLEWEPAPGNQYSRISYYYTKPVGPNNPDMWGELRDWALEYVGKFRSVFQPYIKELSDST